MIPQTNANLPTLDRNPLLSDGKDHPTGQPGHPFTPNHCSTTTIYSCLPAQSTAQAITLRATLKCQLPYRLTVYLAPCTVPSNVNNDHCSPDGNLMRDAVYGSAFLSAIHCLFPISLSKFTTQNLTHQKKPVVSRGVGDRENRSAWIEGREGKGKKPREWDELQLCAPR